MINDREKNNILNLIKENQYEKFNLCETDLADAQGTNLMFAIEDSIKFTIAFMEEYLNK